jgi:transposase InsO family protein
LIVGYAIGRSIDARLTITALAAAIERRKPPPGLIHHSDRGGQGGFKQSSQHLNEGRLRWAFESDDHTVLDERCCRHRDGRQ